MHKRSRLRYGSRGIIYLLTNFQNTSLWSGGAGVITAETLNLVRSRLIVRPDNASLCLVANSSLTVRVYSLIILGNSHFKADQKYRSEAISPSTSTLR